MSSSLEKAVLRILKTLTVLLVGAGIYFFVRYFWPLLAGMVLTGIKISLPILIAYLVAVLLNPVITFCEKRFHLPRTPGTLLSLILFITLLGGLLYLLVFNLILELVDISQQLGTFSQDWNQWNFNLVIEKFQVHLERFNLPSDFVQETGKEFWQSLDVLRNVITVLSKQIFNFVTALPQYFVIWILTLIATFFFARDYELIKTNISTLIFRWLPHKWSTGMQRVGRGLQKALQGYIKAELILISITGFISLIGLSILGVEYALTLALLLALLDLLPIVGPGTVFIPWAIWMIITGTPPLGIGLLILYGIIVTVRQILEPKVLGKNIGLHPLTTLISLYFGFRLLGFWGLILGPAAVIICKAFVEK